MQDGGRYRPFELGGLHGELCNLGVASASGNGWFSVDFCGLAMVLDTIVVSVPKCWDDSDDDVRTAQELVRTLLKYRQEAYQEEKDNALLMGEGASASLVLALRILEDYKLRGLLRRSRKIERTDGNGHIKWAKTVSRKTPIVTETSVFFPEVVTSHTLSDHEEPICRVHAQVVSECVRGIGWLMGIESGPRIQGPLMTSGEMIATLNREAVRTFSRRESNLISLMLGYLMGSRNTSGSVPVAFGTDSFHLVWEHACAVAFDNDITLFSRVLPQPVWRLNASVKGRVYDKQVRQIPDSLTVFGSTFMVLDAKYYDVGVTLPGWPDIVKQLYYRDSIERELDAKPDLDSGLGIKRMCNAFLVPGACGTDIVYLGRAEVEGLVDGYGWGAVETWSLDVRRCLAYYCADRKASAWVRAVSSRSWPRH